MRNLKKILALVLALVMSLSLMATAGAASFQDVKDDNPYKTAIDVLDELKVFQGFEDGTFKPDDTLTRAQAAVLVYRIATGDVEGKYVANYTEMTNSQFTDLAGYNWAKGYINYCQNAKYVIGTSATTFDPGAKVTGYQLLVMLLRVLGYGQAGEFSNGRTWELETAKIAEREGILQNITTGDLGAAAPRQMVAEILFQGLLTKTVQYSIVTPDGYTKGETLGKREFGLEGYEAVVVANEYANLNGVSVLDEGETQVQVKGEDDVRTLAYGSKITDIGERRLIYTQNGSKVLYLADTVDGEKLNVVKEYGEGVDISTTAKFKAASEMNQVGTEFYVNFDPNGHWTCDQRLEFVVTFTYKAGETYKPNTNLLYNNLAEIIADFQNTYVEGQLLTSNAVGMTRVDNGADVNTATYSKIIRANTEIYTEDLNVIYGIFAAADNNKNSNTRFEGVEGDVFVGTYSNAVVTGGTNDNERDLSNQISFNKFVDDYLNPIDNTKNWSTSDNGAWVKFIDNDNDGNCEYAFKTWYWLDEAIGSNKNAAGDTILQYNTFDDAGTRFFPVVYMNDDERVDCDIEVGDIVLAARIDGQILVSEAASVTTSATSYNYKTDSIVAANGETYGQSGEPNDDVANYTAMQDLLASMAPNTEYEMFLDKFGFVRAYRLPGGIKYALVTELYYTNGQYGNLQQNWPMTAELTMPDENGKPVTKEYSVAAGGASQLVAAQPWTLVNSLASTGSYYNWLQPAIAHLGVTRTGYTPTKGVPNWADPVAYSTYWPGNRQLIKNMTGATPMSDPDGNPATPGLQEFNYGEQDYGNTTLNADGTINWNQNQKETASFTNVAIVNGEDTVTLTGAAQLRLGTDGLPVVNTAVPAAYAVDYIQLDLDRPEKGASSYKIDDTNPAYAQSYNYYVNADKDTEIYVVYNNGVQYFKGYGSMPKLSEDLVGKVHAAYAVARNTTTGNGGTGRNYWIADVIVYEVEKWNDVSANSISLAYFTASQQVQTATSVTLETLNSKSNPTKISLVPSDINWGTTNNWWSNWGGSFTGYGFYQLYNETAPAEGETVMSAKAISRITDDYNKSGIYAGVVAREVDLATAGYIPVNLSGATEANGALKIEAQVIITDSNIYSVTDEYWSNPTLYNRFFDANNIWYNSTEYSQVKANDRIMWVGAAPSATVPTSAAFIVDMGSNTNGTNNLVDNTILWNATPQWVKDEWTNIDLDQKKGPALDNADALITAGQALLDKFTADPTSVTAEQLQDMQDDINDFLSNSDGTDMTAKQAQDLNTLADSYDAAIATATFNEAKKAAEDALAEYAEAAKALIDPNDTAAIDAIDTIVENAFAAIDQDAYEDDPTAFDTALTTAEGNIDAAVDAAEGPADIISTNPEITVTPDDAQPNGTIPVDVNIAQDTPVEGNKISSDIKVKTGYTPTWSNDTASGSIKSVSFSRPQTSAQAAADEFVTWVMTITLMSTAYADGKVTAEIDATALVNLVPENPTEYVAVNITGATSTTDEVVKGSTLTELAITLPQDKAFASATIKVGEGAAKAAEYDAESGKLTFAAITADAVITVAVTTKDVFAVTLAGAGADNVTCATTTAVEDSTLSSLTIAPKPGFVVKTVSVKVGEGEAVDASAGEDNAWTFTEQTITADVTVTVTTAVVYTVDAGTGYVVAPATVEETADSDATTTIKVTVADGASVTLPETGTNVTATVKSVDVAEEKLSYTFTAADGDTPAFATIVITGAIDGAIVISIAAG